MKYRICIIPAGYKPIPAVDGGAVETIVQNLIERNEALEKIKFTVLSVENLKAKAISNKYKYTKFVFFKSHYYFDKIYFLFYRFIRKIFGCCINDSFLRYDMVKYAKKHENEFDYFLFEAGEIDCVKFYSKFLDKKKIIFHSHGKIINKFNVDLCLNRYIAVSQFIADIWDASTTTSYKSIVLKNGIKQECFNFKFKENERREFREKIGLAEDVFTVLYVGRIVPEKGVMQLLKAIKLCPPDVKLLCIGSANFATKSATRFECEVNKVISQLGNKVIFTGFVDNGNLAKYYQAADIICVPSIFDDPAPLVIIEAMVSGLPIITTGSGGIKEYCNESCAIFVERDSFIEQNISKAIIYLKNNLEKRTLMSLSAVNLSKQYTDLNQYNNFVDILHSIS